MGKKLISLSAITLFAFTLTLAGCSKKEETVVNPPPPPPAPAAPAPAGPEGQPGPGGPEGKAGAPGAPGADAPIEKKEEGKTK
jgi:hypothetical protein